MVHVAPKIAGGLPFRRTSRLGELCALALLGTGNLAIYLFCDRYMEGLRQCVVEMPLHLLVLLTAHHVLFEAKRAA